MRVPIIPVHRRGDLQSAVRRHQVSPSPALSGIEIRSVSAVPRGTENTENTEKAENTENTENTETIQRLYRDYLEPVFMGSGPSAGWAGELRSRDTNGSLHSHHSQYLLTLDIYIIYSH